MPYCCRPLATLSGSGDICLCSWLSRVWHTCPAGGKFVSEACQNLGPSRVDVYCVYYNRMLIHKLASQDFGKIPPTTLSTKISWKFCFQEFIYLVKIISGNLCVLHQSHTTVFKQDRWLLEILYFKSYTNFSDYFCHHLMELQKNFPPTGLLALPLKNSKESETPRV